MLLWPFNKYPGTDYETFNWEWILKTVKEWVATMQTFKNSITDAWKAMQTEWQEFIDSTYKDQITEILEDHPEWVTTVMDGAITESKINSDFLQEILNPFVTPEMYGAVGDGTTDDTAAFNTACATGKTVVAAQSYKITDDIHITGNLLAKNLYMDDGEIFIDGDKLHVYVEYMTGNNTTQPTRTAVNIANHSFNDVHVKEITGFEWTVEIAGNDAGAHRNTFKVDRSACLNGLKITATGSGWPNDNDIDIRHHLYNYLVQYDTYTVYIKSTGTNRINSNRIKLDFEKYQDFLYTPHLVYTEKATGNTIDVIRCECNPYATTMNDFVVFGANSQDNLVDFKLDGLLIHMTNANRAAGLNEIIEDGISYWDRFYTLIPWRWQMHGDKVGTDHGLGTYASGAIVDYSDSQETNGIDVANMDDQYIYRSPYFDIRRRSAGLFYIILGWENVRDPWVNTNIASYVRLYDNNGNPLDYTHIIQPTNDIISNYLTGYVIDQTTKAIRINERINYTWGSALFFDDDVARVEFIGMGRGWSIKVSNTAVAN